MLASAFPLSCVIIQMSHDGSKAGLIKALKHNLTTIVIELFVIDQGDGSPASVVKFSQYIYVVEKKKNQYLIY